MRKVKSIFLQAKGGKTCCLIYAIKTSYCLKDILDIGIMPTKLREKEGKKAEDIPIVYEFREFYLRNYQDYKIN